MCPKRVRNAERGDWVVAYRLHHEIPVDVPEDRDERRWLADYLVDVYGWSVSRAASTLGFRTVDLAVAS